MGTGVGTGVGFWDAAGPGVGVGVGSTSALMLGQTLGIQVHTASCLPAACTKAGPPGKTASMPELENMLNANSASFFPLIGAAYTSTCGDADPSGAVTGGSGCLSPSTVRRLRSRIRISVSK